MRDLLRSAFALAREHLDDGDALAGNTVNASTQAWSALRPLGEEWNQSLDNVRMLKQLDSPTGP
jgi:hypothetical protein